MRIILAGSLLAACTMTATAFPPPPNEAREEFTYTRPVSGKSAIDVQNVNGSITITGVEGLNEVQIRGVKIVRGEDGVDPNARLRDITIAIDESSGSLSVRSVHPNGAHDATYQVEYEIRVPGSWKVAANNVNGTVSVTSIRNQVNAAVVNGNVQTSNINGSVTANVTNGQIGGELSVPDGGSANLAVVNGQVNGKVSLASRASCAVSAMHGQIKLDFPRSTSASVNADVQVGAIKVNGLTLSNSQKTRVGHTGETLTGTLGSGGGSINLSVQQGSVVLTGH